MTILLPRQPFVRFWIGILFKFAAMPRMAKRPSEKVIELKPDIILLNINMPLMDGLTAAGEIRRISPATKIVFLTIQDTPAAVERTRLWTHGFVPKSAVGTELIPTLTRIVGSSGNPPSASSKPRSATH